MEGTATRVRRDQEGSACVLRFVLVADDGASVAVEMRGQEIHGVLDDGDRVLIEDGVERAVTDGVRRPSRVRNQTTDSVVAAWQPPLIKRFSVPLLTLVWSTAISSLVTFAVGLLTSSGAQERNAQPGLVGGSRTDWFPFASAAAIPGILALAAIAWAAWFAVFGRRRRRRNRVIWPVAPGILLGVTIGVWVAALIGDFQFG